jgi:hypothetical protein
MSSTLRRRCAWMAGAAALVAGTALVAPGAAQAVTNAGTLAVTPSSGSVDTPLALDSSAACPANTGTVYATVSGPGWTSLSGGHGILVGSESIAAVGGASAKLHVPVPETLRDTAKDNGITWGVTTYTLTLVCVDATTMNPAGIATFSGAIHFTSTTNWAAGVGPKPLPSIGARVHPALSGTFAVGRKVAVSKGTWSVARIAWHYQWTRDGKTIRGATNSTYTIVKADKGHYLTVVVKVTRTGYKTASYTPKAKKVS